MLFRSKLNITSVGNFSYILADGSMNKSEIYPITLNWFSKKLKIDIISSNSDIGLIGMELLQYSKLTMDAQKNILTLEPSP